MQGRSFPQVATRRAWRRIRVVKQIVVKANLIPVSMLVALLGAGSNPALAQENLAKSSQILLHDADQRPIQSTAGAAFSMAPAESHSAGPPSPRRRSLSLMSSAITIRRPCRHFSALAWAFIGLHAVLMSSAKSRAGVQQFRLARRSISSSSKATSEEVARTSTGRRGRSALSPFSSKRRLALSLGSA